MAPASHRPSCRALVFPLLLLCGLMTAGCGGDHPSVRHAEASLDGVPLGVVEQFDGRWFAYPREPVVVVDARRSVLLIDAPHGATIDHARAVGDELRVTVTRRTGERREHELKLVDTDLLMIVPVDEPREGRAFLTERLSSFDEMKYSFLKLAEHSASKVDAGLDWHVRKL